MIVLQLLCTDNTSGKIIHILTNIHIYEYLQLKSFYNHALDMWKHWEDTLHFELFIGEFVSEPVFCCVCVNISDFLELHSDGPSGWLCPCMISVFYNVLSVLRRKWLYCFNCFSKSMRLFMRTQCVVNLLGWWG